MEGIIPPEWRLTDKQKRILGYGSAGVAGLYFLYRAYTSDSLAALIEVRERLSKGADAYGNGFLLSGECTSLVMQDLHHFLTSDAEEMPQSLKQLLKLAKSKEFSEATASIAAAASKGAFGGPSLSEGEEGESQVGMLERLMESLTSDRGMNLVKLAVGVACRTAVEAYCEHSATSSPSDQPNFWQQLLEFGGTPEGERLYSTCVGTFVREGTKVWMGSMEGVNPWEDFLGSVCQPERQAAVDRITRSFVNELVVTFLKRSRHTSRGEGRGSRVSGSKQAPPPKSSSQQAMGAEPMKEVAARHRASGEEGLAEEGLQAVAAGSPPAWAAAMVEAAKHPEIRSLILSVAKTATAEGVRTSMFATRDMLLGPPGMGSIILPPQSSAGAGAAAVDLQQQSNRTLGAIFLYVFMPMLFFLIGKRAALL